MILPGVATTLPTSLGYATRDLTFSRVLERQAARFGDRLLLRFLPDGRSWSFAQAQLDSNRLANGLLSMGLGPGAHVALMLENCPEFLLLAFALGKIGAVAVPINTAARGKLLHYYLEHSDAQALVIQESLFGRLDAIAPADTRLRHIVLLRDSASPQEAPAWRSVARTDYAELTAAPDAAIAGDVSHTDLALISYTSGTTGPSKGVLLCQAAALAPGLSNAEHHGYREDDVLHTCLPLFHMNALQATSYAALTAGLPLMLARRFSVSNYWGELRECGATVTGLLGSMANMLWNRPSSPEERSRLRLAICVPVPGFAAQFEQRFGMRLVSSYGISDYGLVAAYTVEDPPAKLGSAGRARRGFRIRIVDGDERDLPAGTVGEILVRCDDPWRVASGYYKMPELTQLSRRDGWFRTGDRGRLDAEGYLSFADRRKDSIRRRGENISAYEVEQILGAHPAVAECAVFPVASDMSEEEVAAAVQLRPGAAVAEAELIDYCRENMAPYMVPRYLEFRHALPRTPNHKVEKYRLRQEMEENPGRAWDRERTGQS